MPSLTPDEYQPTGFLRLVPLNPGLFLQERYTLQGCLGRGAMGEAWLASDATRIVKDQPAKVVLKFLPDDVRLDPVANERFRKEYGRVWQLSHVGICRLFDMGEAPGVGCFQVMQYLEGVTLLQHLRNSGGALPVSEAISILRQAAEAIDAAHQQNVLHRDLKPANIMYNPATGAVHLIDFGLAAEIRSTRTIRTKGVQQPCGTEPYMAPEQWQNKSLTARCDQWALGIIAWQLLTGELPFQGAGQQLGFAIIQSPHPELPRELQRFRRVFDHVFAKKPSGRFGKCIDFVDALEKRKNGNASSQILIPASIAAIGVFAITVSIFWYAKGQDDTRLIPLEEREEPAPPQVQQNSSPEVAAPANSPSTANAAPPAPADLPPRSEPTMQPTPPAERPAPSPPTPNPSESTLSTNSIGMKFIGIPGGEFIMGSDETDELADDDERPAHRVRISPFQMGIHEVTKGQFAVFVQDTGYSTDAETKGGGYGINQNTGSYERDAKYNWRNPGFPQTDDHPVVLVSANDAQKFAEWLSKKEGQRYRLPTEAESEYACRAGSTTQYSHGDDPEGVAEFANVADGTAKAEFSNWVWTISAKDGHLFTAPVGSFRSNAFGLYDSSFVVRTAPTVYRTSVSTALVFGWY
jgi:sulfatase modifying factor 1